MEIVLFVNRFMTVISTYIDLFIRGEMSDREMSRGELSEYREKSDILKIVISTCIFLKTAKTNDPVWRL